MRIGITGHQRLEKVTDWSWVRAELSSLLTKLPEPPIGLTSLALGADQLFAELILQNHGSIEVVLPFPEYEIKLEAHNRQEYQRLLDLASKVIVLQKRYSDEESYFNAGKRVVDSADILIAVWDGEPAKGLGGTADVIEYAIEKQKPIIHINPAEHTVVGSTVVQERLDIIED